MLARFWKKIGLFILIVACIFNIMNKFINKLSLKDELEASATYVNQTNQEEDNGKIARNTAGNRMRFSSLAGKWHLPRQGVEDDP